MSQPDPRVTTGAAAPPEGRQGHGPAGAAARPTLAGFGEVFAAERDAIAGRRRRVYDAGTACDPEEVRRDLVGLALSGGGIRSAMFNLGLLQALYERKFLPFVDYLSTVSGGGYIGSYLSLLASRSLGGARNYFERYPPQGRNNPLRPCSVAGEQTLRTNRICYKGNYLMDPWAASNRYSIGLVFILLLVGGALTAACSLIALFWRLFDAHWWRDRMELLDLSSDLYAPLFPIGACVLAWLAAWGLSYWLYYRPRPGSAAPPGGPAPSRGVRDVGRWNRWVRHWERWRRLAFVALIASLLISAAILIGNGDVTLGFLGDLLGQEDATAPTLLRTILIGLVGLGLLPLLRTRAVIRSGEQPTRLWQVWIFRVTIAALVGGVPLLVIGFIGQENISGFATSRAPDIRIHDIRNWAAFHAWFREEEGLWRRYLTAKSPQAEAQLVLEMNERLGKHLRDMDDHKREIKWGGAMLLGSVVTTNPVSHYLRAREGALHEEKNLVAWLNGHEPKGGDAVVGPMEDPDFFRFLAGYWETHPPLGGIRRWLDPRALPGTENSAEAPAEDSPDPSPRPVFVRDAPLEAVLADRARVLSEGRELAKLWERAQAGGVALVASDPKKAPTDVKKLNRLLLEALYPAHFHERTEIRRLIVVDQDQKTRLWWLAGSVALCLVMALAMDVNFTSMHRFYQDRLAEAYLGPAGKWKRLADVDSTRHGGPYHLLVATLNLLGRRRDPYRTRHIPFVFAPLYCGSGLKEDPAADRRSGALEYKRTDQYLGGTVDLATAMALSGAAVGPTSARTLSLILVMAIFNLRLGQWLPRPSSDGAPLPVTPWRLLREFLWRPGERWRYGFISDGGHHENLGLEQLLARRCRLIVAIDASQDENYQFADLADLVRRVRVDHGIRLANFADDEAIDAEPLRPDPAGIARRHFVIARIEYPRRRTGRDTTEPEGDGILVLVKPNFTGDEDVDLHQYRRDNSKFPHDATIDQFYDERKVESYRQLGHHTGEALCDFLDARIARRDQPLDPVIQRLLRASDRLRASSRRRGRGGRRAGPEAVVLARVLAKALSDLDPGLRTTAARTLEELTRRDDEKT